MSVLFAFPRPKSDVVNNDPDKGNLIRKPNLPWELVDYPDPPRGHERRPLAARWLQTYKDFIMEWTDGALHSGQQNVVGNMVYRTLADSTEGYTQITVTEFDGLNADSSNNLALHERIMEFMSRQATEDLSEYDEVYSW